MLGAELHFCLRYAGGIRFAKATEVEEKWAELATNFMEDNMITN